MLKRILPRFSDLQGYNLAKFKSDLSAGIVTGIVAIPLSLALATATGVDAIYGLYTAAIAGILASIFAGSRYNVSGPAAAMVPILVSVIDKYGIEALPAIGVIAGMILVLLGLFKLGRFIKYVPLSVTIGFTAGVAIVLFFGQLNNFLGLSGIEKKEHFHEKVEQTIHHIDTINWPTVLIGLLSLAILISVPQIKYTKKIPPSLISVIVCTALVYFGAKYFPGLHLDQVKLLSSLSKTPIEIGFPPFQLVKFDNFINLIEPAFKVAVLIAIESLLCAVVADKLTKTKHRSNQELIAQGIANMIAPFFSAIPSTAVIARTGTSVKNGAQTRLAALIHATLVLLFLLLLAPIGNKIPLTVLSSVLFITAWKISEQKEIRHLIKVAPKSDIAILFLTLILTVFLDLTVAVTIGMFLAILIIFSRLSTIHAEEITEDSEFVSEKVRSMLDKNPNIQFINLEGNLSMGAAGSLSSKIKIDESSEKVVIRLREVHHIDVSGLEALDDFIQILKDNKKEVYLTSLNKRIIFPIMKYKLDSKVNGIFENTHVLTMRFK